MSIINDAIKKVEKQLKPNFKDTNPSLSIEKNMLIPKYGSFWIKKFKVTTIVLLLLVVVLEIRWVYKYVPELKQVNNSPNLEISEKPSERPIVALLNKNADVETVIPVNNSKEDIIELKGIVYSNEERWAIINDTIVKEGDSISKGRLSLIAENFIRIKKDNGEEISVTLR